MAHWLLGPGVSIGVRRCAIRREGGSLAPEPQAVPIGVRRWVTLREGSLAPGPS